MKALITAAGKGTRLEHTAKIGNKCLLKVGTKSLLEYSISSLQRNKVKDIYVITGHNAGKVESKLKNKAKFIFNPFYGTSGILISIWLARHELYGKDFMFLTGDVLYDPDLLPVLIKKPGQVVIPIQRKDEYDAEGSKVIDKNGKVKHMGKEIPLNKASGEFCYMIKFNKAGSRVFFDKIEGFLRLENLDAFLMDVINVLIKEGISVIAYDVSRFPVTEIDYIQDLRDARSLTFPLIKEKLMRKGA